MNIRICLIRSTLATAFLFSQFLATVSSVYALDEIDFEPEQNSIKGELPLMGACQFYVKVEAVVNGQKKSLKVEAGNFLQTAKGGTIDAECKGRCDVTGPDGGQCECGYMTMDAPPEVTGMNSDGTPILEVLRTYHSCRCGEVESSSSPLAQK